MMNENSETSFHSAKAFAEFSQKKANDVKKKEAATKKANHFHQDYIKKQLRDNHSHQAGKKN